MVSIDYFAVIAGWGGSSTAHNSLAVLNKKKPSAN